MHLTSLIAGLSQRSCRCLQGRSKQRRLHKQRLTWRLDLQALDSLLGRGLELDATLLDENVTSASPRARSSRCDQRFGCHDDGYSMKIEFPSGEGVL